MKFYKKGDKSKAICSHCGLVSTTFDYRDLIVAESNVKVSNVLAAVCDTCGKTVSTPAQSTSEIKKARENKTKSLEVMLPSVFLEVLNLAGTMIDSNANSEMIKRILQSYIHNYVNNKLELKSLIYKYEDFVSSIDGLETIPKKRISLKVSTKIDDELNVICKELNKNKTEMIKILVSSVKTDIVDNEDQRKIEEIRQASLICS
ncbi:hypothetical protein J2T26_003024 [Citrobacter farmeri]|uniref:hypothetical protein n=1 Tax=Citrobacter farmeri TaxID=67824 RepID=UPI00209F0538|nr:hypothetical protein [Citrobacter farmeri]MCP1693149.1 hypothetical protein [Citrobacter farmeri]MCW2423554.1 hypothetical protein [Citrobacter farmeri]